MEALEDANKIDIEDLELLFGDESSLPDFSEEKAKVTQMLQKNNPTNKVELEKELKKLEENDFEGLKQIMTTVFFSMFQKITISEPKDLTQEIKAAIENNPELKKIKEKGLPKDEMSTKERHALFAKRSLIMEKFKEVGRMLGTEEYRKLELEFMNANLDMKKIKTVEDKLNQIIKNNEI